MLSLSHLSMQFGGRYLFQDVSLMIGPHDRIGLVGSNGTGKSTLLKIIAGIIESESGTINKAHYVTAGYLPQDGLASAGMTLYKEVETAFENVITLQQELEEAHATMASTPPESEAYSEALEIYGELQHKLEDLDVFRMKSKIEQVLMGLGFSVFDFERPTEEFSGGWQMRIELAKLLLQEPSILLLDEPTNHLDLESLQWLEEYLQRYNGAIILVSHDRAFLDDIIKKTWSLSIGKLEEYAGNYSFFEKERIVRKELLLNAQRNQQQQIKQTQEFIERFRYKATKARQVQSRIKQLEKIESIEVENEEEEIHFRFAAPPQSGRIVMELRNLSKSYGPRTIFSGLHYLIERGDRIAVVGVNGAGKSTFARIMAGVEPFQHGERIVGYNVMTSYFAQHQAEELDLSKEALQTIDEVAAGEVRTKLRTILGSFLFHGDDVFKRVGVLSGGEKSRLALVKMLLQPSNFLVMDEPTNHLDMKSKKVLQGALKNFEGSYLIVSHDRNFLDPIVTKVIEVKQGEIRTYLGNVSEYLQKKKNEILGIKEPAVIYPDGIPVKKETEQLTDKERRKVEAEKRQQLSKTLQPLKKRLEQIEREISSAEKRKKEIETMMSDPDFYKKGDEAKYILAEFKDLKERLDQIMERWTKTADELQQIKSGYTE